MALNTALALRVEPKVLIAQATSIAFALEVPLAFRLLCLKLRARARLP